MGLPEKQTSSHKKGIPSKKNREDDPLTQAAEGLKQDNEEELYDLIEGNEFNFDDDDALDFAMD